MGIIGGIVLGVLGSLLPALGRPGEAGAPMQILGVLIALGGSGLQLWGCYYLVKGKGYHGALSILGFLCCLGLLILLVLPNKYGETKSSLAMTVLVVAVVSFAAIAVLGIILAIAIPHYVSYKRTTCDRVASADAYKLAAAFERLRNELADQGLQFDDDAIGHAAERDVLRYLVGPYYGFGGSSKKCGVLMRMRREDGRWTVEGVSTRGSHPSGQTSRYVYRAPIDGAKDLPAMVINDVADAENGKSLDWNAYPYAPHGQPEMCYSESVVQAEGPPGSRRFSVKVPKGVPCTGIKSK